MLVVDDTNSALKKTKRALENCNHHVTMAENGLSALKLMKQNTFDLVLMDKEMPTMNGVQATRDIRAFEQKYPERRKQFIICVTGEIDGDEDELLQEIEGCGMDGLMIKPFTVQGLDEVLEALCNERKKSLRASFVSVGDNGHSDAVGNGKEDEMRLAETIVSGTSD